MAGKWSESSLRDLIDVKHGFAFQGEFIHDEPHGDVLLTPGNFAIGGGFKGDKFKYFDGPVPSNFVLAEGDLLVTMTDLSKQSDTLGLPAFVPSRSDGRRYLHNQRLGKVLVKDKRAIDIRFLHYLMYSSGYRHEVLASATGTTVKHTSPERIRRYRFSRPPIAEQRAIAHILGMLDDKIELNRRMNETLEAMARALFKSWFVDFEPVRAKMEGRWRRGQSLPGLPAHLYELFPDRLVDSELGEIPEGWHVGMLLDLAELNPQNWSKTSAPESVRYVDLANTKWGSITSILEYAWESAPSRARRVLQPWDTIVGTVRPGNGSYVLVMEQGLTGSTGFAVLRPREPRYRALVYCAATSRDNIDRLSHLADGAAYPAVRPDVVAATRVVTASDPLFDVFARMIDPLLAKVAAADQESRALAGLRDALLPKLISGELRVEDAERFIGRAT